MSSKKYDGCIRVDQYVAERPDVIQVIPGFNARTNLGDLKSLKDSILQFGLRDALWVRLDHANKKQPFILIDGERRLTALQQLYCYCQEKGEEWSIRIPLQVFHCDEEQAEELMALAALEREGFTATDEAGLVSRWIDRGYSCQEVSTKLNKSLAWVEQRKLLSSASVKVKSAVADGTMPLVAALDLVRKVATAKQGKVLDEVMQKAAGQKNKLRGMVAQKTGTSMRPGKKDLLAVVKMVSQQSLNGETISARDGRRLAVDALRYAAGEISQEDYVKFCLGVLTPKVIFNSLEL